MRLAFIVADARAQKASWSTAWLAHAAASRGHDVGFVSVDDLTLRPDNSVTARVMRPSHPCATREEMCTALAADDALREETSLTSFDVVFLRYHPRREGGGVHRPVIDFGWRLRLGDVQVYNDPEGTQRAGGRMYIGGLPAEIRPRTLVTRDSARVKRFLKELDAAAVVKPFAEQHAGVDSVFYLARGQSKNLNQILQVVRKTGYMVVQEYLPEVTQGEKRLLLLAGEPIRHAGQVAIYRRWPDGTRREPTTFGPEEQRIVDLLRPRLEADGLYLVGVDIAGSKVLEVNVYTPGGIRANHELYGFDVSESVVRDLERRVEVRRAYRKSVA